VERPGRSSPVREVRRRVRTALRWTAIPVAALSLGGALAADAAAGGAAGSTVRPAAKLVGAGAVGRSAFGTSVALSGDGRVAVVGGPLDAGSRGAIWVFKRRDKEWPGTKLRDGTGKAREFGRSVATSADGKVVLVGAPGTNGGEGAVWVFADRGGGVWVGTRLVPKGEKGKGRLGASVALSPDGRRAIVGAPVDDKGTFSSGGRGAAWMFERSAAGWRQYGPKITGLQQKGNAGFGTSVAFSTAGTYGLVGGPGDDSGKGAAWLVQPYLATGSFQWQRKKLTATTPKGRAQFGQSVALANIAGTMLIGGRGDDGGKGAAWAYDGTAYTPAPKLVPSDAPVGSQVGRSVAASADGSVALVGGPFAPGAGAAWLFVRSGDVRAQQGTRIVGGNNVGRSAFGSSVAIARDGSTLLVGGPGDDGGKGAAWVLVDVPEIVQVSPGEGPTAGGTKVRIGGTGLASTRTVLFGQTPAQSFTVDSPTEVTAVTPPGQPGAVDVRVVNSVDNSPAVAVARFTYLARPAVTRLAPAAGPATGGTEVTVTGTALTRATTVKFGTVEVPFKVDSDTQLRAQPPAAQPGVVHVTVTTPAGTSATSDADRFTYTVPVQQPATAVVKFDDLAPGPAPGLAVTTQYTALGVTFSGISAIDYGGGGSGGLTIVGFPYSGSVAAEACVGVEFCTTPIRATFGLPKRLVRVRVGLSAPLSQPLDVQLRALAAGSTVVGTATVTLPASAVATQIRTPLEVSTTSAVITQLEVSVPGGYDNGLAVDDVEFG
jgi:hypothetical protein